MKTPKSHSVFGVFQRRISGVFVAALLALPAVAIDPDLPYSSGSTGADTALTFREIIPGGRGQAAMVYFPPTQKVLLFGGQPTGGGDSAETWEWDGTNWKQLFPVNSPPSRYGTRMVFDAERNQIVLFGGYRGVTGYLNDTWVWENGNWTQKTQGVAPPARQRHMMAFDGAAGRRKVVLFGGDSGNNETWTWDGAAWSIVATSTKPGNYPGSGMTFDAARNEVVMFNAANETWIWNGTEWVNRASSDRPGGRNNENMVYDPTPGRQKVLLFGGDNRADTWEWDGLNWAEKDTSPVPARAYFAMTWDAARARIVMYGGNTVADNYDGDTWLWNGLDWALASAKTQIFDMSGRANGTWNYSSINVPAGVTVRFNRNAANTPVRWLATNDVVINGLLDVSGERGANTIAPAAVAKGGPGGYDGGARGVKFAASTTYVGAPGQGPGGGLPGTAPSNDAAVRDGKPGTYDGTYGNVFLQPLLGGSGGGGGSSSDATDGGAGGGGGGAIMIATSRDLVLNGAIRANGGDIEGTVSNGGRGSGGGILLKADRISGPGTLEAFGGNANVGIGDGRIRIEAYIRPLTAVGNPVSVAGLPGVNGDLNNAGATLRIVSVKGVGVPALPTGNLQTPDVVFSETGAVTVQVSGTGIPDGTPVVLRVATANGVITANANLAAGGATINVASIPKGLGTLQATAEFAAP